MLVAACLFVLTGRPAAAQTLPTDAELLARIAAQHPCPARVPPAWTASDSSLGHGTRCSLVVAAAAALRALPPASRPQAFDPDQVDCVQIYAPVFRSLELGGSPLAYWSVEFLRVGRVSMRAVIERPSGRTTAGVLHEGDEKTVASMCNLDGPSKRGTAVSASPSTVLLSEPPGDQLASRQPVLPRLR